MDRYCARCELSEKPAWSEAVVAEGRAVENQTLLKCTHLEELLQGASKFLHEISALNSSLYLNQKHEQSVKDQSH